MAKKDLGNGAVIMNTKKITPKGLARLFMKGKVEVTAAIDENIEYQPGVQTQEKASQQQKESALPPKFVKDIIADEKKGSDTTDAKEESIEEKLNHLKKMIEQQMEGKEKRKRRRRK